MWDATTLQRVKTLTGHTDAVRTLAMSGDKLFSGAYDGTLRVGDINTLECPDTLAGHTGPVRALVTCAGKVFSGSYDKTGAGGGGCRWLGAACWGSGPRPSCCRTCRAMCRRAAGPELAVSVPQRACLACQALVFRAPGAVHSGLLAL